MDAARAGLDRRARGRGHRLLAAGRRRARASAGDGFVATEISHLVLRASQLGPLKLQFFCVQPQFLNGLITVTEGHQLERAEKKHRRPGHRLCRRRPGRPEIFPARRPARAGKSGHALGAAATLVAGGGGRVADVAGRRFWPQVARTFPAARRADARRGAGDPLAAGTGRASCIAASGISAGCSAPNLACRCASARPNCGLQRARQLLADANAKVINVAYESGYRHLGLFNAMFKKRFGVTPSEWRQQNLSAPPKNLCKRPGAVLVAWLALMTVLFAPHLLARHGGAGAGPRGAVGKNVRAG